MIPVFYFLIWLTPTPKSVRLQQENGYLYHTYWYHTERKNISSQEKDKEFYFDHAGFEEVFSGRM